jgi:hypothetical protein
MPAALNYGSKAGSDPAANTEASVVTTDDLVLVGFNVSLVTDANAANRHVQFTVTDPSGNVIYRTIAGGTQAASLTRHYSGVPGEYSPPAVLDTVFLVPLPPEGVFVPAGSTFTTATLNRQVGDNFGTPVIRYYRP